MVELGGREIIRLGIELVGLRVGADDDARIDRSDFAGTVKGERSGDITTIARGIEFQRDRHFGARSACERKVEPSDLARNPPPQPG